MEMPIKDVSVARRLGQSDRHQRARELLALAGITVNGGRAWDMHIHHPDTLDRVLGQGARFACAL